MKIVRKSVFETNSSSTHSISIVDKRQKIQLPNHIDFYIGNFYREYSGKAKNNFEIMASYLYCTILQLNESSTSNKTGYYLAKLSNLLLSYGITFSFELCNLEYYDSYITDDCFKENSEEVLKSLDSIEALTTFLIEMELDFEYEEY